MNNRFARLSLLVAAGLFAWGCGGQKSNANISAEMTKALVDGNIEAVESLLEKGENPNAVEVGGSGRTALHIAAMNGKAEILQTLASKGAALSTKDANGHTALMIAADAGMVEAVQALIDKGAPIDDETPMGETALMIASASGQVGSVEILLAHGADLKKRMRNGRNAYLMAVEGGHNEIADLFKAKLGVTDSMMAAALQESGSAASADSVKKAGVAAADSGAVKAPVATKESTKH